MTLPAETHHPSNQCTGKRAYPNRNRAKRAARMTMTRRGGGLIAPYLCPHCGWFHVGHPPKRRSA